MVRKAVSVVAAACEQHNKQGLSLTSMQERLKLVDGKLSIDSKAAARNNDLARVPLNPKMRSAGAVG